MKNFVLLFVWILLIVSCESHSEKEEIPPAPSGFGGIDGKLCFKSESNPLEGYTVNIGGKTSITNSFGYFLSIGIVMMIGLQALLNIGVSIGALPTKGLPLPFISYGGSALISSMIMVGLLLNVAKINDLED